ncbi:MATE family efflux transporter [Micromonospora aurantiaca]|uniref:MATE family efflux transporter n=1 Tax=Micromonospora aurantiaca (nom. illeg.) TaxID=47850 RepID=UPI0033AE10E4
MTTVRARLDLGTMREVIGVSLPLLFGMVGNLVMLLVNRICLARYSQETLEASGPAVFTASAIIVFFTATAAITRSYVAQAHGRGEPKEAAEEGAAGLVLGALLALLLVLCAPLIERIPQLSTRPESSVALESVYLWWAAHFGAVMVLNSAVSSYFNGVRKTRVVMLIGLLGQAVEIVLTIGLVFGRFGLPELGMRGAGVSTLISALVMFAAYVCCLPKGFFAGFLRLVQAGRAVLLRKFSLRLRRGLPSGGAQWSEVMGQTAFVWIAAVLGTTALAANNVILSINYVAVIPLIGLGIGCSILTGNALGARDYPGIRRAITATVFIAGLYIVVVSFLQIVTPVWLLTPFGLQDADAATVQVAVDTSRVLWMYSVTFLFSMVGASVLESFGLARFSLLTRLVLVWGMSVPIIYGVSAANEGDPALLPTIWIIGSVFEAAIAAVTFWRIRKATRMQENNLVESAGDSPVPQARQDAEAAQPPSAVVLDRFPAKVITCFNGSLVKLVELHGGSIDEAEILERGDGYLLRAGHDELGYPEYAFSVEAVGLQGVNALGARTHVEEIDAHNWRRQLRDLTERHRGAAVWVNSAHLSYADIYANSPGYLHAVVVLEVSEDLERVRVYDSLVVDRARYGCEAWLPAATFESAVFDRVKTPKHDHMGFMHIVTAFDASSGNPTSRDDLQRQATLFLGDAELTAAVESYRRLCDDFFDLPEDRAKHAARRLFDHIKVLYVVPNLSLLERSIIRVCGDGEAAALCRGLSSDWTALALMGLKFEATLSAAVRQRINDRFRKIDAATLALWEALQHAPVNAAAPSGARTGEH